MGAGNFDLGSSALDIGQKRFRLIELAGNSFSETGFADQSAKGFARSQSGVTSLKLMSRNVGNPNLIRSRSREVP
jgi:hypothetical protein